MGACADSSWRASLHLRRMVFKSVFTFGLCALTVTYAQSEAPALIRVIRYTDNAASVQTYVQAKVPINVVGLTAISGKAENWLIEMHDSFGSIEDVDKALASPLPANSRAWIGFYRQGLSYRAEEGVKALAQARYVLSTIFQVRFGADADFAELVRQRRARYDFVNLNRPEMAYQVISGMASGTYVFLTPVNSLRALVEAVARTSVVPDGAKRSPAGIEISQEHVLFRIDPRLSHVSGQFAESDPDFWSGKSR